MMLIVDLYQLEGGAGAKTFALGARHVRVVELSFEPALRRRRTALARFEADLERALAGIRIHSDPTFGSDMALYGHDQPKSRHRPVATPHAILAHHLNQHAFAQPAVGHPQPLTGEGAPDGVENGATGKHQVRTLGTDASIGDAIFVAPGQQAFDHARHFIIDHPAAVDAATLVASQLEMDAGDRRYRARRAEQVDVAVAKPAVLGHETVDQGRDLRDHGRVDFGVTWCPPWRSASVTTPTGSDAQALIFGSGGPRRLGGERSRHTSSEEPPPMSNRTTPSAYGSINGVQPVAANVASVSRSMTSSSRPTSSAMRARNSPPFAAARHASVAISRARVTPRLRILSRQIASAAIARSIAASLMRPDVDTPSPRRMMRENASMTRKLSPIGRATRSRQLLVPRSSAA